MSRAAIAERTLAPLLGGLVAAGESGVVRATRGKHKRVLCLDQGTLTYIVSNVVEEQYEHALKREGLFDTASLAAARAQAEQADVKLSRWLLDQEDPGPAALRSAMLRHVRGLLESTLGWDRAEFAFARGRADLGDELTVELRLPAVLLEHARSVGWPLDRYRMKIGPPNATPLIDAKKADFLDESDRVGVVGYLLDHCDGSKDILALCEASPADTEETIHTLYGLKLLGLVQAAYDRKAEAPSTDTQITRAECEALLDAEIPNHYAVLGLERNATGPEIREAYYYLARRYHPDRFRSGPLTDLRERVEGYFSSVTEAYNTLIDEVLRAEYDQSQEERLTKEVKPKEDQAYLARTNYARARVLIDKRRFQDSVQFLENAVKLDPDKAEYHMELGRVLIRNPRRRKDAERHLERAIEINPTGVAAHFALGELYAKSGRTEEAAAAFREVLRWEPSHVSAREELKALGGKPDDDNDEGGLLRGLFRK